MSVRGPHNTLPLQSSAKDPSSPTHNRLLPNEQKVSLSLCISPFAPDSFFVDYTMAQPLLLAHVQAIKQQGPTEDQPHATCVH